MAPAAARAVAVAAREGGFFRLFLILGAVLAARVSQKVAMSLSPRSRALLRVIMSSVSETSSRRSFGVMKNKTETLMGVWGYGVGYWPPVLSLDIVCDVPCRV